jgi:hypothetical protein
MLARRQTLHKQAAEQNPTYRGLKWMTEEEWLNAPGLKVVAVETAVKDLLPTAARGIAAGMHIHLDKPAGQSEFREMPIGRAWGGSKAVFRRA